jgi:hypothetical protein
VALQRLALLHERIRNARWDALHKFSTNLVKRFDRIYLEKSPHPRPGEKPPPGSGIERCSDWFSLSLDRSEGGTVRKDGRHDRSVFPIEQGVLGLRARRR